MSPARGSAGPPLQGGTAERPAARSTARRRAVLMLVHSYYEEDPRVRREAEALVAAGHPVDVVALRRPGASPLEVVDGVAVHRLPVRRHQGAGIGTYLAEYGAFFARATAEAARLYRSRRHGLVQVHSLPDPLVFAAAPMRLAGTPVLLDLHEAMPEFFRSRFPAASRPLVHGALLLAEHASVAFASRVLTVNDALADRLADLGVDRRRITVVLNSPRTDRFDPGAYPARRFMADGTLRLIYTGALTPLYQIEAVLRAMVVSAIPSTLDLYGRGDAEPGLQDLAVRLRITDRVRFHGRIPIEEVPACIAEADAGVAPTRRDPFTDFSLSTKIFEYAAMRKPVLASRLATVERYFGADALFYFAPGDATSLAAAIERMVSDEDARAVAVDAAGRRVGELSWEREAARYVGLVEEVISRSGPA